MNLLTRLEDWPYIILPIIIVLSFLLLGWLVEKRVVSQLLSIAREKNLRFSEGVLRSLRGLSILWFGLLGLNIALSLPNLPLFPYLILLSQKLLLVAFLASATWAIAQLSVEILRFYTTGDDGISSLTSLFEFLAKVLIFSCGFLLILSSIGISITPMSKKLPIIFWLFPMLRSFLLVSVTIVYQITPSSSPWKWALVTIVT